MLRGLCRKASTFSYSYPKLLNKRGFRHLNNSSSLNKLELALDSKNSHNTILQPTTSLQNNTFQPTRKTSLSELIKNRKPYHTLFQEFYTSPEIFDYEMTKIWSESWLFVGWTCELNSKGDYITYQVGNESVIVVRGDDDQIRAFHNICRHRGSRILTKESGRLRQITCPYHGWTYSKQGALTKASWMSSDMDQSKNGLIPVHVRELHGTIFINLSPDPRIDFNEASEVIGPQIEPHEFQNAKIAYSTEYEIKANWKLVYENNRECYHCPTSHPEYIRANYDTAFSYVPEVNQSGEVKMVRTVDDSVPYRDDILNWMEVKNKEWKELGLVCSPGSDFPGSGWYRASRTPSRKGWVTESLDGKPVAPLMGRFKDRDMGSCRIHTLPNSWIHASSDYACSTRLTPISLDRTSAKVSWLVHKDAEEDKDYELSRLLPFWKATSEQDWVLCENNQLGVSSRHYRPGTLSVKKESGLEKFLLWYLKMMAE